MRLEGDLDPVLSASEFQGFGFLLEGESSLAKCCWVSKVGFVPSFFDRRIAWIIFTDSATDAFVFSNSGILVTRFETAKNNFCRFFVYISRVWTSVTINLS